MDAGCFWGQFGDSATVSVLSGGGGGVGDAVSRVDRDLVAATCRQDGRILALSHPLVVTPLQESAL